MTGTSGFSVEDFLEAITNQLDRTQDSLRLKSVTRPLTYAIRDFSMELKVYVELAPDGRVMFRPSAADDAGASVVHIGFTTVNRTMIEENTVSLSAVRSPTLDELGLDEQERRGLERLGIRNAAQLDQLKRTTGENTVSRYSGLPVSRLRQALAQSRPSVRTVRPVPDQAPPQRGPMVTAEPDGGSQPHPQPSGPPVPRPPVLHAPMEPEPSTGGPADRIRVPARTRRIVLGGPRLDEMTQRAHLGGRPLDVRAVDGGVELDLGEDATAGTLELDLGDEGVMAMSLDFDVDEQPDLEPDPWRTP